MNLGPITINCQTSVEAYLSPEQQKQITLSVLYKIFDWEESYYIEDDKVYSTVEYATSHRWTEEELIRKASEDDYNVCEVIEKIKKSK